MNHFYCHADLDDPAMLVEAVAAATGQSDVRMLGGWHGNTREDSRIEIVDEVTGAVNIEWLRRKGRFSLDVHVYGPGLALRETAARFCRAVARALGRQLLFSDCGANPFSYFLAEPDGSLWRAYIEVLDDTDIVDLVTLDADNEQALKPRLVAAPDAVLPLLPDGITRDTKFRRCDLPAARPGSVELCHMFAAPCPMLAPRPD